MFATSPDDPVNRGGLLAGHLRKTGDPAAHPNILG